MGMGSASNAASATVVGHANNNASARSSPAVGPGGASSSTPKPISKINSNGYHPTNPHTPLSSLFSLPLDLTSVERRNQPTAVREPLKKKSRPHGIEEAPTYRPTEEEWRDSLEYIKKIGPEASQYGICKIIPPEAWNPDFAIDTEKFHFRTRKQELNSVEGSTRANLTYLDGLSKYHKQHGSNLHRLPYVDKKPLDLYKLKKAVESRGGFEKVCKGKKWAEIGRDLGYSGKIMSSLSTSLKNSFQKWLWPYEEYLRVAKPGVHQQLEAEYGGPLTPSPAVTPMRRSNANTPMSLTTDSPARLASDMLQSTVNGVKKELERDVAMTDAPPVIQPTSGFTAVNTGGFTAVNSNANSNRPTPDVKRAESPAGGLGAAAIVKRKLSTESSSDSSKKDKEKENGIDSSADINRRSKRLKKDPVPTVAGSHMSQFRPTAPRIPRDDDGAPAEEKCTNCGKGEETDPLLLCESCDHAYHGHCLDPPAQRKSDAEWNCPRCLVGDGQFGFEEGGLYSLKQFQQKANDFKQGYFEKKMPFDHNLNCHRPVTEEDVESEFWRLVADLEETVEVEYGADIHCTTHGSGFPTLEKHPNSPYSADPWNLNVLPFHPDSLFRHIKSDISGMTVPWVYVGMIFSTFCWHNEDHYAYSANYQHLGATKTWYGIPGEDAEKFEAAMREAVPELFETQPDLLFQLVTLLTPEQLKKAGVRVYAVDQRAGQFVITFPQAYHAGFNHGFNFNEAVNFAPSDWEPFGLDGVKRLQLFRRQPCFSHDELLWTAAEGSTGAGLTIQTAKWLAGALEAVCRRELTEREDFISKHVDLSPHHCRARGGEDQCPLAFEIVDEDVHDEEEQCCSHCKGFAYFSRFKCLRSGKVTCILHAGLHACCDQTEEQRYMGAEHVLIFRKPQDVMDSTCRKVVEKAQAPEAWEEKYTKLLDEETNPSLKSLRALLHEGEKIPYELVSLPVLKQFVDRCNDWVDDATNYIVRKQQNRRKSDKMWQSTGRKSAGKPADDKERDSRSVDNIHKLLRDAEQIGFDCPEIGQLKERANAVTDFQRRARRAIDNSPEVTAEMVEELLEEGRGFFVDIPEMDLLSRDLDKKRWNTRARSCRGVFMSYKEVEDLTEEGKRLGIPAYNDHYAYYREQLLAGEAWEMKAKELMNADFVHYQQLEALAAQVQANALPVSQDTLAAIDQILQKQREAHRQIVDITNRSQDPDITKRPKYSEVTEICKKLEELNSKPNGTIDLENERKRHEDWMRKGKKLFGKSNAPLHILKSHLEYVLERNGECFDIEYDTPRVPGEPVSREATPEDGQERPSDGKSRQVFCICRRVEMGMMIECELCHEWYHYKCLKIARGKVKEDDKYTCPICDWRMKIPRDASRPKLEDLIALVDEIPSLPFQPEEEEPLRAIINNAQTFRDHIAHLCTPLMSAPTHAETMRFYLRKIEGAEVLLAFETNFFRQELHKWCQVAPNPPPFLEVSLSTRKPRPTKLQKMLAEYGVDNPDDLPEHAKGKANSLRRKAIHADTAAHYAAQNLGHYPGYRPYVTHEHPNYQRDAASLAGSSVGPLPDGMPTTGTMGVGSDNGLDSPFLEGGGPQLHVGNSFQSLEDRLLHGDFDNLDLQSEEGKSKALEILSRTEKGKQQAERIWGPKVWDTRHASVSDGGASLPMDIDPMMRQDDGTVDQMFKEMTNQEDDEEVKAKEAAPASS